MDCINSKKTSLAPWPDSNSLTKSLREASEFLGIHYNTLYHRVKAGEIEHIKIGSAIHFTYDQIENFLNNHRTRVKLEGKV